jgi:hypothetical protein
VRRMKLRGHGWENTVAVPQTMEVWTDDKSDGE